MKIVKVTKVEPSEECVLCTHGFGKHDPYRLEFDDKTVDWVCDECGDWLERRGFIKVDETI